MPEALTARPSGLRADSARNRETILARARIDLLAGDDSLAMNGLAKSCGLGVGTVYRHFPTRSVLLESLAIDSLERLAGMATEAAAAPDIRTGIEDLITAAIECQIENPGFAAVLSSAHFECADTVEYGSQFLSASSVLIDRAREAGLVATDLSVEDLRHLVCGVAVAVRLSRTPNVGRYVRVLVQGLGLPRS